MADTQIIQVRPGSENALRIIQKPLPTNTYFHDPAWNPTVGIRPPLMGAGVGTRVINGVLLHFTAGGSAIGAWSTFASSIAMLGYAESVPYIIDLDGTVWQCHDESIGWGYHIGVGAGPYAKSHMHDRRLVGIEIVCPGPLWLGHDGESLTWNNGRIMYGKLGDPTKPVFHSAPPYRGVEYFVPMTQAQQIAAALLVAHLQQRWRFAAKLAPASTRFLCNLDFFAGSSPFEGVQSHVNYRTDKWDQTPGHSQLIWDKLEDLGFS